MPIVQLERAKARAPVPPCAVCGKRPRAGCGTLSRCIPCIAKQAEIDRVAREQRMAAFKADLATAAAAEKSCRTCRKATPLEGFFRHRLSKDGHRHDCIACAKAERTRRRELSESESAIDQARRAQPHRRASNRRSVQSWTERNPEARQAAPCHSMRPDRAGEGVRGRRISSRRIEAHHPSYRR